MIVCVDVDYRDDAAYAAVAQIAQYEDGATLAESVVRIDGGAAEYEPGEFYRRELPCILAVLDTVRDFRVVVIDGYVWLARDRPGLGARLHDALGDDVSIIGVAKTAFHGNDAAVEVLRGTSARPLFVTAAGIDVSLAARHVRAMHGAHRIPTVLARVDRLARDAC